MVQAEAGLMSSCEDRETHEWSLTGKLQEEARSVTLREVKWSAMPDTSQHELVER